MKRNDSLERALRREVREETGLVVKASEYLQMYDRPKRGAITILYRVLVQRQASRMHFPAEDIVDLGFFDRLLQTRRSRLSFSGNRRIFLNRVTISLELMASEAEQSAHAICSDLGSVNFSFKWRHRDGSTIEFNPMGWTSDDPLKADWLSKMNQLSSAGPAITPVIRTWLQNECELISVSGPIAWDSSVERSA